MYSDAVPLYCPDDRKRNPLVTLATKVLNNLVERVLFYSNMYVDGILLVTFEFLSNILVVQTYQQHVFVTAKSTMTHKDLRHVIQRP